MGCVYILYLFLTLSSVQWFVLCGVDHTDCMCRSFVYMCCGTRLETIDVAGGV